MTHRMCMWAVFALVLLLALAPRAVFAADPQTTEEETKPAEEPGEKKADERPPAITEEITVEGKAPEYTPFSTNSTITQATIEPTTPRDLTEVLNYTTGTYVSGGNKNEWGIKVRGLDTSRVTLMTDGIPVYEPYFNSFDLKTFSSDDIEAVRVVKGASSVLYGPNTLGGIVEVLTHRPAKTSGRFRTNVGNGSTYDVSGQGALKLGDLIMQGFVTHNESDGFVYPKDGENVERSNSDYDRTGVGAKVYFYPGEYSEILGEFGFMNQEYGIPPATSFLRPNYWRFKDWERLTMNVGGTFPFLAQGNLKARGYYVKYYNVLDAYKDGTYTTRQWESTYDNHNYGVFLLGNVPIQDRQNLQFSFNAKSDNVKQQSDINKPWENYEQSNISAGVEDTIVLTPKWSIKAGLSIDHLMKEEDEGNNKTTVNPIAGLMFAPADYAKIYFTVCQKSRFPSMRQLYSSTGGNPDLADERGTNVEVGFSYGKDIGIDGAVFYNKINDMIDRVNLPDGTFIYQNFKEARIAGFELSVGKDYKGLSVSGNYTYLNTKNITEDRPLDTVPGSTFSLTLTYMPKNLFRASLWGVAASSSTTKGSSSTVELPAYAVVNMGIDKTFHGVTPFFKVENLLNAEYATSPGYPMMARAFTVGLKFDTERLW